MYYVGHGANCCNGIGDYISTSSGSPMKAFKCSRGPVNLYYTHNTVTKHTSKPWSVDEWNAYWQKHGFGKGGPFGDLIRKAESVFTVNTTIPQTMPWVDLKVDIKPKPTHNCTCGSYAIGCKTNVGHSDYCSYGKDNLKSPNWFQI